MKIPRKTIFLISFLLFFLIPIAINYASAPDLGTAKCFYYPIFHFPIVLFIAKHTAIRYIFIHYEYMYFCMTHCDRSAQIYLIPHYAAKPGNRPILKPPFPIITNVF